MEIQVARIDRRGETEVSQLHVTARIQEHVITLDIAMNVMQLMHMHQRLHNLKVNDKLLWQVDSQTRTESMILAMCLSGIGCVSNFSTYHCRQPASINSNTS